MVPVIDNWHDNTVQKKQQSYVHVYYDVFLFGKSVLTPLAQEQSSYAIPELSGGFRGGKGGANAPPFGGE